MSLAIALRMCVAGGGMVGVSVTFAIVWAVEGAWAASALNVIGALFVLACIRPEYQRVRDLLRSADELAPISSEGEGA